VIDPPKPEPTMQTSTCSDTPVFSHGRYPFFVRSRESLRR